MNNPNNSNRSGGVDINTREISNQPHQQQMQAHQQQNTIQQQPASQISPNQHRFQRQECKIDLFEQICGFCSYLFFNNDPLVSNMNMLRPPTSVVLPLAVYIKTKVIQNQPHQQQMQALQQQNTPPLNQGQQQKIKLRPPSSVVQPLDCAYCFKREEQKFQVFRCNHDYHEACAIELLNKNVQPYACHNCGQRLSIKKLEKMNTNLVTVYVNNQISYQLAKIYETNEQIKRCFSCSFPFYFDQNLEPEHRCPNCRGDV